MVLRYRVSTLIERPINDVFHFVACFENQSQWQAATVQNDQITPGAMTGPGSRRRYKLNKVMEAT